MAKRTKPRGFPGRRSCVALALSATLALTGFDTVVPDELPDGTTTLPAALSFVGLDDGRWYLFTVEDGRVRRVDTIRDPGATSVHPDGDRVAWTGPDGILVETMLADGTVRHPFGEERSVRHTQPRYAIDGSWLYVVELPAGQSRTTRILGRAEEDGVRHALVAKRTAQFEPFSRDGQRLFYTTALCVDDCPSMIWELWERDHRSGEQRQLTLLNAVARQPFLDENEWLWFSSDAGSAGRHHIWRTRAEPGATAEQMTRGDVRDVDPVVEADGTLWFLRHTRSGTRLMRWKTTETTPEPIALPDAIDDLRELELSR